MRSALALRLIPILVLALGAVGLSSARLDAVTWSNVTESPNNTNDDFEALTQSGSVFIVVGAAGTIYRSTDWGETFTEVVTPVSSLLNDVVYDDTVGPASNLGIGLAVGAGGIVLRYTDADNAWASMSTPNSENLNAVAFDGTYAIAVGEKDMMEGTIIVSADGGANWSLIGTTADSDFMDVVISGGKAIVVGTQAGMASQILYSCQSGCGLSPYQTWTSATVTNDLDKDLNAVDYDGTLALAVGKDDMESAIYYSNDDGASWTLAPNIGVGTGDPEEELFDVSISGSDAVAVGGKDMMDAVILYSTNDGVDWEQATWSTNPDDIISAVTLVGDVAYSTGRDGDLDGTAGESTDSGSGFNSWDFDNDLGHSDDMNDVVYDNTSTRALVVGNDGQIQKTDETNLPPYITSDNGLTNVELSVVENTTAVTDVNATDSDGDGITYAKSGGTDQALFNLDGSGVLTFSSAPDYESPPCATAVFSSGLTCLVEVSATDAAGTNESDTQMITVTITDDPAENSAPVLANIEAGALSYTEGGAATPITATLTTADSDDTNLESATIQITGNLDNTEDVLAFANQLGITGSFTSSTGLMTLTGTASVANYQTALRAVTYQNTDAISPSTATRTITFIVNDGTDPSNSVTRNISITAVNDAPVLDNSGTMNLTTIAEDATNPAGDLVSAVIATSAANAGDPITDVDGDPEGIAVIAIDETSPNGNWQYAINGTTWNDIPAVLNTSALLLAADADTRIRFVPDPNENGTLTTGISFRAWDGTDSNAEGASGVDVSTNGGTNAYSTAFEDARIIVSAVNDAPVLASIEGSALAYSASDPATPITASLAVSDIDDTDIESATIQITGNLDADDRLAFTNQLGITAGAYNSGTGILSLTGTASVANYETALRTVTYENINANPPNNTRTVTFTVNDGSTDSNTQSRNIIVTGGVPSISVSPDPIAFGFVAVGVTSTITVTVSNSGGSALIIAPPVGPPPGIESNDAQFVPSTTSLTVPAGGSNTFDVQFTPTSGGVHAATLTILSNAPTSPTTVNMTGEGTISITPSVLAFGNVAVSSINQQQITLTNNTGAIVTVDPIVSSNAPEFTVLTTTPFTINDGTSATVDIQFQPQSPGPASAIISITYNPTLTVTVTGCADCVGTGEGTDTKSDKTNLTVPFGGEVYLLLLLAAYGIYALSRRRQ